MRDFLIKTERRNFDSVFGGNLKNGFSLFRTDGFSVENEFDLIHS